MNMGKAQKEVERREASLDKLIKEKDSVAQSIESLKGERSAAVRALAGGDEGKRKTILNLESKMAPLSLKLQGICELIAESQAETEKAQAILKEAEREHEERCQNHISEGLAKDSEALLESVPGLLDEAVDCLLKGQLAWGKAIIIESALRQRNHPKAQALFEILADPAKIIQAKYSDCRFTHLDSFPTLTIRAGTIIDMTIAPEGRRNTRFYGELINRETKARIRRQFDEMHGR